MRALLALAALAAAIAAGCDDDDEPEAPPSPPAAQTGTQTAPPRAAEPDLARTSGAPSVETLATNLEVPWEIAFLPDGSALITERPGRVRLLPGRRGLRPEPLAEVDVNPTGEGGLLGLAVDPEFERNTFVYLYRTTNAGNEVARYRLSGRRLEEDATIVRGILAAPVHDGGRIHFGPDDRLYISTGDAGQSQLAQDPGSLNGKILRMDASSYRGRGGRPEVFTLGHRNPQGFDWEPGSGRLYQDEHGAIRNDEVNLLREGRNYGWPAVEGSDHGRFTAPLAVYEEAIAPAGASFVSLPGSAWSGDYLIAALAGEQLRRLSFDGAEVTRDEALFEGDFGRLRTVVEGPDGALYALTSNRDGRGQPREGDDRVLRIVPPAGR